MQNDHSGTCKFSLIVGRLIHRQVRGQLNVFAFERGYTIRVDEDKGFFDTTLYVTISGIPQSQVASVDRSIRDWIAEHSRG